MRTHLTAAALFAISATMACADPFFGVWQTPNSNGAFYHVKVQQCGASICGKVVREYVNNKEVQSKHKGKSLLYDMVKPGGSSYEGKAWRPSDGKVFKGKANVSGKQVSMKGCVLGGLICQSQNWSRVN